MSWSVALTRDDACPAVSVLTEFSLGRLSEDEIGLVGSHLEHCSACLSTLDTLNSLRIADDSWMMSRSYLLEPALADLKARARSLVPEHSAGTDTAPIPLRIGDYELLERIGWGGFSTVFSARDLRSGKIVAVKVLCDEVRTQAYPDEAKALQALSHPSIVSVFDCDTYAPNRWFVAMEYIEGESLRDSIRAGRFDALEASLLVAKVARALHHAHTRGFVHRDVKPENILVDRIGQPRVTDFGLAVHDDHQWDHRGQIAGTRPYMSPEQVRRESHRLDGRTDVWALGVTYYELLTGQRPFRGSNKRQLVDEILHRQPKPPRQIRDSLPVELERICLRCLSKAMTDRYSTALDLAADLESYHDKDAVAFPPENERSAIVPKGLCSFERHDSDFFLPLLPGPRDRHGIPETVRFWKTRIEERTRHQTFSVGLLYGPSGCGKSSFVKAGLLPHLDRRVHCVYLEATQAGSEERLLSALANEFPQVSPDGSLQDAMLALRQRETEAPKVLVVIDQFEHCLHAWDQHSNTPLIDALRQCDGALLQCLLIVRDDFWMGITSFLRRIDVQQTEGFNVAAVPLFSIPHAKEVLVEFGRAYGRISSDVPTVAQQAFVARSIDLLSEGGQVVCLRMALFAQMMKDRPWVPSTLRAVGGLEGLGVKFLEESINAPTAPRSTRIHAQAIARVLRVLLPDAGNTIRGASKSRHELLRASGYAHRPDDFCALLRILDNELRLITPVAEEGTDTEKPPSAKYQLSHDYLVASLRTWLHLRDETTLRGRATIRLKNRERNWRLSSEKRQLPDFWETLDIWLLSDWKSWTGNESRMMRRATWHHAVRGITLVVPTLLLLLATMAWFDLTRRVSRLQEAKPDAVADAIQSLRVYRPLAIPYLRTRMGDSSLGTQTRLRAALALSKLGSSESDEILQHAEHASPEEIRLAVELLKSDPQAALRLQQFYATTQQASGSNGDTLVFAALMAINLGDGALSVELTRAVEDPSLRAKWIDRFPVFVLDYSHAPELVSQREEDYFQSAVCLGLANVPQERFSQAQLERLRQAMVALARRTEDAGVRAAVEYAFRRWNVDPHDVASLAQQLAVDGPGPTPPGLKMIELPDGVFVRDDGKQRTPVKVVRFALSDCETSRELFGRFVAGQSHPGRNRENHTSPTPKHPANYINVDDAIRFVNWLSQREQLPAYYRLRSGGWHIAQIDGPGYRLPTESEWEYACRAGVQTVYVCGSQPELLGQYAVFGSLRSTEPCASKMPNPWGFFDLSGNVWEWCVADLASPGATTDGVVSPSGGITAVIRGGAYDSRTHDLHPMTRYEVEPDSRLSGIGFRVARSVVRTEK